MLSKEIHLNYSNTGQLKVKVLKKIYHAHISQRKIGVAILIAHKINFRAKKITINWETHKLEIIGQINHEDIIILNEYKLNNRAANWGLTELHPKLLELKRKINIFKSILGKKKRNKKVYLELSTLLSTIDKTENQQEYRRIW